MRPRADGPAGRRIPRLRSPGASASPQRRAPGAVLAGPRVPVPASEPEWPPCAGCPRRSPAPAFRDVSEPGRGGRTEGEVSPGVAPPVEVVAWPGTAGAASPAAAGARPDLCWPCAITSGAVASNSPAPSRIADRFMRVSFPSPFRLSRTDACRDVGSREEGRVPSGALPAEVFVEVVEHRGAARQPPFVLLVGRCDALDEMGDAGRLRTAELGVLQVDVMHDLADGRERPVVQARAGLQHLEGAAVAVVGVLALVHVEAQLAGFGDVALRGYELEPGLRIDEAPDEPGRGDPVHVDPAPRHPDPSLQRLRRGRSRGLLLRLVCHRPIPLQPGLKAREQPLNRLPPVRPEEVDRRHPRYLGLQPGEPGTRVTQ